MQFYLILYPLVEDSIRLRQISALTCPSMQKKERRDSHVVFIFCHVRRTSSYFFCTAQYLCAIFVRIIYVRIGIAAAIIYSYGLWWKQTVFRLPCSFNQSNPREGC